MDKYIYSGTTAEPVPTNQQATKIDTEKDKTISRWGDNSVKITLVQLLDKFGQVATRFRSFDPMTIRIHYCALSRISAPVFGISIYTEDGKRLFGTNTERKDMEIGHVEGKGYIDLKIDRITMLSGKFLLTVAVHSHDGKPYDWIDRQYSFDILPNGRDAGIFEIPCRWITP